MGAPAILLIIIVGFIPNLIIYGLANRNISANAGKSTKNGFWLGIIGPLGTVIRLIQCVEITGRKLLNGFGRFFIYAILIQILGELNEFFSEPIKQLIHYIIGLPFILRGKNVFNYSTKSKEKTSDTMEKL